MPTLTKQTDRHKTGVLSDDTTEAILEHYLHWHGPATEARLEAVLEAAKEAVMSVTLFLMTMQGQIVPEQSSRGLLFSNAPEKGELLEPIGDILRRVLAEVPR
jgi:hypothetical protein